MDPDKPMAEADDLRELLGYVSNCWDDERRALARQLHDSMGSSLTALTMHLGLLASRLPPDQALHDRAAQMKQLLHAIIDNNRAMQHRLWNDKLEFLGMCVALDELVTEFGQQHQLRARCSLPDDEPDCPRMHRVVLLRALEAGLRNIASDASASQVEVVVDDMDDSIVLVVRDDGSGRPGAGAAPGQHGLRLVRERAACLGGTLTLAAIEGKGSVLTVTLPKPAGASAA